MKVIDLLNKIANGEKVPKEIKYRNKIFDYEDADYFNTDMGYLFERYSTFVILNDEVEIIEEEKKIPEELSHLSASDILDIIGTKYTKAQDKALQNLFEHIRNQDNKINEIIDYLQSKGE